jgi:putative glutamine amidotransferase
MVKKNKVSHKPVIGITCEVMKLKPYYSEFELACDYRYMRAIIRAGGTPVLLPINHKKHDIKRMIGLIDGLLMIGGADIHPTFYKEHIRQKIKPMYRGRTLFDINLYWEAQREEIPILAICYGMQLLNVIYGGTLHQDIQEEIRGAKNHRSKRNPFHIVHLEPNSHLAKVFRKKEFLVRSQHHQAVKHVGQGLRVVGYSPDGVPEAIEGPPNTIAVQWHPERSERDIVQQRLFRHFVHLAKANHGKN